MISGQNFFDQLVKNTLITYDNIRKIATVQADDYTTSCLLDYNYFNKYHKMIATDLSKQQALEADPNARQQTNFTGDLDKGRNDDGEIINDTIIMFFIIEEAKETILGFSQGTVKSL